MDSEMTLAYKNEDDRAYGLAGMAVSLAALDALDRVVEVSLDAEGPMVSFSHEYYFTGSPTVSPKATWNNLVENFYITTSMAVSNVMARSLVRMKREVPADVSDRLRKAVEEEGEDSCSLEQDEIDALYRRSTTGMRRIFGNPRVYPAIEEFARFISRRRVLSGTEIYDELRMLRLI